MYRQTSEDQSLCIKSCSVEIASDYMKKRNVFQVTTASGSKFLFQAEDTESMSSWVKAIQSNSELKEVKETVSLVLCDFGLVINIEILVFILNVSVKFEK